MTSFKTLFEKQDAFKFLKPYIIAEIGVNHENSMETAKLMIKQIAEAGGHAAKFQTYKADKLAAPDHAPSYWDRNAEPCESQHKLFQKYDKFGVEEYKELAAYCDEVGVDFVTTPFDIDSVHDLAAVMKYFKVASADITNIPLMRAIGSYKKPVLVSVGAATLSEIEIAIQTLKDAGASDVTLMHCVLNYPTPKENAQMSLMRDIMRIFGDTCQIGYSDHVKPEEDGTMPALEIAVLQGAVVIEKHYTHDKSLPGNDHYHAMDKDDLAQFTQKLSIYQTLDGGGPRNLELEVQAVSNARRRIIAVADIKAGEELTDANMIALRSNTGVEISRWDDVIGQKAANDIQAGDPICWGNFS